MPWGALLLGAALALAGVYAYAAAALWAHARLPALAPPRTLAGALLLGALLPACGCTALPHARRAPPRLRAPFLVAAYAANPLLLAAAWLLAGWRAALVVLAVALAAALVARLVPEGERPRARLDDLLLRRDARPLRDALPYVGAYWLPALAAGAVVGLATRAPAVVAGLCVAGLGVALLPPRAELAHDHGARFTRGTYALLVASALAAGGAVWLLSA